MAGILSEPVDSPYLVPFDGSFKVSKARTRPDRHHEDKRDNQSALAAATDHMRRLQPKLYAADRYALLIVFQAMDAAGKDGTIRAVMSGVNPAGCQVFSFKQPSNEELDHDFLWRVYRCLPERGRIGIFNRSHYEEVLAVRVHPEYLERQRIPRRILQNGNLPKVWHERLQSIRSFEKHLARNGTVIVKFWLNVSKNEQRKRFLARIDKPEANWKMSTHDVEERDRWDDYMHAYEEALNATSRPWAPWYVVPADNKPYMRRIVAEVIAGTLDKLDIDYPVVSPDRKAEMLAVREELLGGR